MKFLDEGNILAFNQFVVSHLRQVTRDVVQP
jgi:hypothetical protein